MKATSSPRFFIDLINSTYGDYSASICTATSKSLSMHPPLWSDFVALRDEPLVVAPIAEYEGALVRLRLTKGVKLGERRLSMNVGHQSRFPRHGRGAFFASCGGGWIARTVRFTLLMTSDSIKKIEAIITCYSRVGITSTSSAEFFVG